MTSLDSKENSLSSTMVQTNTVSLQSTKTIALVLAALGVVYGDIGTSPLYAIKECFSGPHAIDLSEKNILGVLSLVFWSLTMVVSFKYVLFILRADNKGEGGVFALLALLANKKDRPANGISYSITLAAVFGAALLYGDGVITPAISVLSAVEGLEVATHATAALVIPLTCVILFGLFLVQRHGTASVGKIFGPVMAVWFAVLSILGIKEIILFPHVLSAINPLRAYEFFAINRMHGMVVLGSVVLCITGGEALYADLGHFGIRAIRFSWFTLVFPALILNYFGQGALLLYQPEAALHPFYGLVPRFLLYPMVALSTLATVIASQAMISGAFSLTKQAIQLGFCPRLRIIHTSSETEGQIYVPIINFFLMLACIGLVLAFRSSSRLAGAYGIAVTATMGITSVIYFFVLIRNFKWSLWKALPLVSLFLLFDLAYFGANLLKVPEGGWFTLLMAAAVMMVMTTWWDGRKKLAHKIQSNLFPLELFLEDVKKRPPQRVRGTAVFMTVSAIGTPAALLHHLKHNQVLHEKVVILTVRSVDVPTVPEEERLQFESLGEGFYRIIAFYGFSEIPHVPNIMKSAKRYGLNSELSRTTYYLGRETLIIKTQPKLRRWRASLFAFMARNAQPPVLYFSIPANRVIELGTQIEI